MNDDQQQLLLSEMQQLADTIHRRAYSHVPQWRVQHDPRSVLSQIDNMVAGLIERVERLQGAISWLEPPLVDDDTSFGELKQRVKFMLKDAQVDRSPEGGDHEDGHHAKHESAVPKGCAQGDPV